MDKSPEINYPVGGALGKKVTYYVIPFVWKKLEKWKMDLVIARGQRLRRGGSVR